MMNNIFQSLVAKDIMVVYLDDILNIVKVPLSSL